ncbi:methionine synthase II (cobalamin-independent) [Leucobacter luti]|uniref:Methionine synthase II (Cobalamin-independent) n=1 Tax=Leucobacter luti TaxID=340320 RepID=A0A4R6S4C8_9MICO|nr:methionine synthase II (cobalamin-independent) [Leucobacter luti]
MTQGAAGELPVTDQAETPQDRPAPAAPWPGSGLPTEAVGSLPRPSNLQRVVLDAETGLASQEELTAEQDRAVADTLTRFAATGSPIVSDGEQRRQSFASYPLGTADVSAGPVFAVFADGHHRVIPSLARAPFAFQAWAASDVAAARALTELPLKQAVISPSMLSLMVPAEGLGEYSREDFLEDVVAGCAEDIRRSFAAGASRVSIDFTEGRLALRRDVRAPWAGPEALGGFIALINRVLDRLTPEQRAAVGVHTCPGNDNDSAHSADVDYAELLPELFQIEAGYFLVQAAGEREPDRVARLVGRQLRGRARGAGQAPRVLLGVTNPTNPKLETAEGIRDQLVRAARFIPAELLGSTDDCGFSPYLIDEKPRHGSPDFARDVAFAKIAARVRGTALASTELAGAAAAEPLSYAGYGATGQAVPRAATPHQGPAAGSVAAEDSVPGSGTAPHPAGGAA